VSTPHFRRSFILGGDLFPLERAVSTGSKQAFVAELVASQEKPLRRFLRTRVGNASEVPDLIQEIFLRLLRVSDHESIRSPEAYLFTVARHVAQQHTLRESTTPETAELKQMLSELNAVPAVDPALEVGAQRCLEELDKALSELPPRVRATFLLHRCDGMTLEDIGRKFGVSRSQAKKYLAKALVQFRKHIEE
jgi:RNA polymerase sigma factor (sigma-70 family)